MMGELYTAPAGTPPDHPDAWTPVGHLVTPPPATAPRRVRMTRQRPWRANHPDAVIVARPSKWGNGFRVVRVGKRWQVRPGGTALYDDRSAAVREAVARFRWSHTRGLNLPDADDIRRELRGRDLACWCPLDEPCHADVLLAIANGDPS